MRDTFVGRDRMHIMRLFRTIVLLVFLITIVSVWLYTGLGDPDRLLTGFREYVESAGVFAPLLYSLFYILAVVLMLPGTILGVLAGVMFGSVTGVVLVSISSTIGAGLSFLISRYLARDIVMGYLSRYKRIRVLYELTEREGALIVGVTRLIPIFPFNLLNYAFGLTKVRFRTYIFWSWLCMLPGTIIVVVGTDAVVQSIIKGEILYNLYILVIVMVCVLFIVVWFIKKRSAIIKKLRGYDREP